MSSSSCRVADDSMGTSIVALRLTCARLHFHVSGASKPREASGASAGNSGCSFSGSASSLITSLRPCSGWGCPDALGTAKSSNQVGRTDWTPIHWRNLHSFFCGRRPLPFGGSHLRLPSGPAGIRTTTGSLSALARPTPYQLSHRVAWRNLHS